MSFEKNLIKSNKETFELTVKDYEIKTEQLQFTLTESETIIAKRDSDIQKQSLYLNALDTREKEANEKISQLEVGVNYLQFLYDFINFFKCCYIN